MTWTLWVGVVALVAAAALTLLGFLAFWRQGPPIEGTKVPSYLSDTGEHAYVGRRRERKDPAPSPPPPPAVLEPTGHADEWMWDPAPPAQRALHRWEHLGEQTRPMRAPNRHTE